MAAILGGLLGSIANPNQNQGGVTPQQAMLAEFQQGQAELQAVSRTANTGTEISTGTTLSSAGANLGAAQTLAQQSDVNAANAMAANSPLQNLLQGNQQFTRGANDFSNQSGNTFNSPSNTGGNPAA